MWNCLINVWIWQLQKWWWWGGQLSFIQLYKKLDTVLNALYLLPFSILPTALGEGFELLSPFCRWDTGSGTWNNLLEIIQPKSNLPDLCTYPLPILHFLFRKWRLGIHSPPPPPTLQPLKGWTGSCISISSAIPGAELDIQQLLHLLLLNWILLSSYPCCGSYGTFMRHAGHCH